jgi:adenylosuccinate synthase
MQYDEAKFKELLGFNFYLPDALGKSFNRGTIHSGITIFDIALKDQEAYYDEFFKAIFNENAYKGLVSFKMRRSISANYFDNEGNQLNFYISKLRDESKMEVIKEFNIEGIQCKLVQLPLGKYPYIIKGNTTNGDVTK